MSSRAERLKPAVDVAHQRSETAVAHLADHQQHLARAEQQLSTLKTYRRDYSLSPADGALTANQLINRHRFVEHLDQAIVKQSRQIEQQQTQTQQAQQQWRTAHARESALTQVVDRYQLEAQHTDERRQQNDIDERSQLRHRSKSPR